MSDTSKSIGGPRRPSGEETDGRDSAGAEFRRHLSTVLLAIVIALLVRALVVETYYVPSESMLPTLLVGDHMLVNKFAFGARLPLLGLRLPALRDPKRGDVVTFVLGRQPTGEICPVDRCPDYPREGFVKRIVGIPGDEIEVVGDRVFLNEKLLLHQPSNEVMENDAGDELRVVFEYLDGASHPVLDHPRHHGMDQIRVTVPEGRYFMMGDNRDDSNDSRGWGTVRRAEIIGPVTRLYWSWNNRSSWWDMLNPATWWNLLTTQTRWNRIGLRIH